MAAPARSPYLEGNYAPVHTEVTSADMQVVGEIPGDLAGVFVRNSSNPRFDQPGRYHWFDGDGMLHAVHFTGDGRACYRNRWVRTRAFQAEQEAGRALWPGGTERPDFTNPRGPFKDTANTDVVYHGGELLALWWLGGEPYAVGLPELETRGVRQFDARRSASLRAIDTRRSASLRAIDARRSASPSAMGPVKTLSAHPKVDPVTGEMVFFDYKPRPPYLTYGVLSPGGELLHHTTVDLPGPRLQHDMAITEHYAILLDVSLMWDPALLQQGRTKVRFFRDKPTRFGILGRRAPGSEIRWFETEPCYIYHLINAWEEGDRVVVVGCRIDGPLVDDPDNREQPGGRQVPSIGFLRLVPRLHRWTFDLVTGAVQEEQLDDVLSEFPRMDNRRLGRRSRYAYSQRLAPAPTLLFDAVIKYDTDTGAMAAHQYPAGWYGGETVFAPRVGAAPEDEDDGYLLTFVAQEATGASELYILDARDVARPPVGRVRIPQRVPTGYHTWWVSAADLLDQRGQAS